MTRLSFRSSSSLPISSSRKAIRVLSLSDRRLSISLYSKPSTAAEMTIIRPTCMFDVVVLCSLCKAKSLAWL